MELILYPILQLLRFLSFLMGFETIKIAFIHPLSLLLSLLLIGRKSICQQQMFDALKYMRQRSNPSMRGEFKILLSKKILENHQLAKSNQYELNLADQTDADLWKISKEQARLFFDHLSLSILEWIEIIGKRGDDLPNGVEVIGEDLIEEALSKKKGLLLLTLHMGNWEVLLRRSGKFHHPVHVISKLMHQKISQFLLKKLREGAPSVLYGKNQAFKIAKALKNNEIVVDVLDQHCQQETAIPCMFFGKQAYTQSDFFRWQSITGAELLFVYTFRRGLRHVVQVERLDFPNDLSIEEKTKMAMLAYEKVIWNHFEQWLWIHRRWKEQIRRKI